MERKKISINANEVRKIELQRIETLKLLGYKSLAEQELSDIEQP